MEPKAGETYVFNVSPHFKNKTVYTVKEIDNGWVVLVHPNLEDWHVLLRTFHEYFTKVP